MTKCPMMNCYHDEMLQWWNVQWWIAIMMKCYHDEMLQWWNVQWWNAIMMKCYNDEMLQWWNVQWWNAITMKCYDDEMSRVMRCLATLHNIRFLDQIPLLKIFFFQLNYFKPQWERLFEFTNVNSFLYFFVFLHSFNYSLLW